MESENSQDFFLHKQFYSLDWKSWTVTWNSLGCSSLCPNYKRWWYLSSFCHMIYNRKLFSKTELFQLRCYPKIGSQKQWGVHTSVSFRVYATFLVVTIALKQAMDHCKNPVLEQNSFVTTEWNWFVFLSK